MVLPTQADVYSHWQVHARHLDGAGQRVELVVLDFDAAAEQRLQGAGVGQTDTAPHVTAFRGRRFLT
jgi:hypothetical protein